MEKDETMLLPAPPNCTVRVPENVFYFLWEKRGFELEIPFAMRSTVT